MIKKATLEQVQDEIDALQHINRLKAMSDSATENVAFNANVKLLEIAGIITNESIKVSAEGSNIRLVIED